MIWRNVARNFKGRYNTRSKKRCDSEDGGDADADADADDVEVEVEVEDLCCSSTGGFTIGCFSEGCNKKCHLDCEHITQDTGLVINDDCNLLFYCRDHFFVEKFCSCVKGYGEDKDMMQCDECKNWFHTQCVGSSSKDFAISNLDDNNEYINKLNSYTRASGFNNTRYACHKCRLLL